MSNREQKHAVVIGAGFGGIASALRLKALGNHVTLIDRAPMLGGRAQVFIKDGFTFDAGPTVLTAPFLLEELFSLFGKKSKDYIEIIPLKLWYRYLFEDGRTFDYGQSLQDTFSEICKFSPHDLEGYKKLLEFSQKIFHVGFEKLSCQPFHHLFTMIKTLPELIRLKSYKTVYDIVAKHIKDDSLRRAFSISPLLVGGNPFQTTSIYTLIHYLERKWGVHFAKGGTGALVRALGTLIEEQQIDVKLRSTVTKIVVENGRVKAVICDNDQYLRADHVVVNGDPAYVYKNLIDLKDRKNWTDKKIDSLSFSMGLFVLYFGTNVTYDTVAHHTICFGKTYRELLKSIFKEEILSDDMSLYVHRPTATDPSMAPPGCDSFYALAPVPNLRSGINWDEVGPILQQKMLKLLEDRLLPNLKKNLVNVFYLTPENFKENYLSEHGAGFSIAPLFSQSAYFRFHNKSEIESLYFVGAGTHPGAGLPGVLCSAKVVENIIKSKSYA